VEGGMKKKLYKKLNIVLMVVPMLLIHGQSGFAATQSMFMDFEAVNQDMWGGGSSFVSNDSYLVGLQWDESDEVRVAVLGTGVYLGGSTAGYIGFNAGYSIDSGSVDAYYPVNVALSYPDTLSIRKGDTYTISSAYTVDGGAEFQTVFPEIQAYVDLIFELEASVYGGGATIFGDVELFNVDLINTTINQELVGFNRNDNGMLTILGNDTGLFGSDVDLAGGYGELTVSMPDIETNSNPTSTGFESSGGAEFIEMALDLDYVVCQAISELTGIPFSFEGNIAGLAGYDLLDIDAGFELDILQEFLFEPELMVSLEGSDGNTYKFKAGESVDLVMGDDPVEFIATYYLDNSFSNTTLLKLFPELELAALEAWALGLTIGPLFETELQLGMIPPISVYDSSFSLNFQQFAMEKFTIMSAVPEPATLFLFGIGLAGLAGTHRSRNRAFS
jgi:hypothetical protein